MVGYPKWFNKKMITVVFCALSISGLVLIPNALNYRLDYDIKYVLQGNLRILSTSIHTLTSYLMFLIIGALFFTHIRLGIRKKKNVKSGIFMLISFAILCLSGMVLFYLSNEFVIALSSLVHICVGLVTVFFYVIHLRLKNR